MLSLFLHSLPPPPKLFDKQQTLFKITRKAIRRVDENKSRNS